MSATEAERVQKGERETGDIGCEKYSLVKAWILDINVTETQ